MGVGVVVAACVLLLTACRVDVTIDVDMAENGSGELSVTVVADADVVVAAPGLAEDLRVDDLRVAGWSTEGAMPAPGGALALTIVHPFDTPEQATALLSTLNGPTGPLQAISIQRIATISEISYSITGNGRLDGGLEAFADPDLLATVGGTPYAEQIAASGASPIDTVGVVLRLRMPGTVQTTTGRLADVDGAGTTPTDPGTAADNGASASDAASDADLSIPIDWVVALDGSETVIQATSVKSLERGGGWPVLAQLLLVLLLAWVALSVVAILLVARRGRRRRRSMRRVERRLTDLPYERVYHDDHTS
jgi:hypothetical protein